MAASNLIGTAGFNGVIQKYLNRKWFDLPMRNFETPLANSTLGALGTIPNNQGQSIEFRKFSEFLPAALFDQKSEPASDESLQAEVIEVPLKEFSAKTSLGNLLLKTDQINLMQKSFDELMKGLRRGIHCEVHRTLVNGTSDTGLFEGSGDFSSTALKTIFAGDLVSFDDLVEGSYFRMRDFENARSRLENDGVPPATPNGNYAAIISHSIETQLIVDDPDFRDAVKHSDRQNDMIIKGARLIDYNRITFILQHDEYRTKLPGSGGALATRVDAGRVQFAHILGKEAFAYIDLAGDKTQRQRAMPKWKVQDITETGVNMTIGYRVPFRSVVIDTAFGLNIAGTTKFSKGVSD